MFRLSLIVLALAGLLVACGGGAGAGATPEDTFAAAKSAVGSENWGALYDLLSEDGQKEFAGELKDMQEGGEEAAAFLGVDADELKDMELRDFFILMWGKMAEEEGDDMKKFAESELIGVEKDGNKATLKFKMGDKEEEMELIEVDGKWLLEDIG